MKTANKVVMTLAGGLLMVAALLKFNEMLTLCIPSWREAGVWESYEFFLIQIPVEFALGAWMVSGLFRKAAWVVGTLAYFGFIVVTLVKAILGFESCGCFGQVHVNPWITLFAIDIPFFLALAIFRPRGEKLLPPPWPHTSHALATAAPILAFMVLAAPVLVAFRPPCEKPNEEEWQAVDISKIQRPLKGDTTPETETPAESVIDDQAPDPAAPVSSVEPVVPAVTQPAEIHDQNEPTEPAATVPEEPNQAEPEPAFAGRDGSEGRDEGERRGRRQRRGDLANQNEGEDQEGRDEEEERDEDDRRGDRERRDEADGPLITIVRPPAVTFDPANAPEVDTSAAAVEPNQPIEMPAVEPNTLPVEPNTLPEAQIPTAVIEPNVVEAMIENAATDDMPVEEADAAASAEFPQWPWLQHIDIADQLNKGLAVILMYHHDCPTCAVMVPKYNEYCQRVGGEEGLTIAFVAIPPFGKAGEGPVPADPACLHGKLSEDKKWAITSPYVVALLDGAFVKAWPQGTAPEPEKLMDEIFQ